MLEDVEERLNGDFRQDVAGPSVGILPTDIIENDHSAAAHQSDAVDGVFEHRLGIVIAVDVGEVEIVQRELAQFLVRIPLDLVNAMVIPRVEIKPLLNIPVRPRIDADETRIAMRANVLHQPAGGSTLVGTDLQTPDRCAAKLTEKRVPVFQLGRQPVRRKRPRGTQRLHSAVGSDSRPL